MHYHRKRWEIPLSFQMMAKVEIRDVAIAYNNRVSLETYLIVLRNELLRSMTIHNLVPPFLIGEESFFPWWNNWSYSPHLSSNVRTIYDEEMGDFSNSPTWSLTLDKKERWHDTCSFCHDQCDPQAIMQYADAEALDDLLKWWNCRSWEDDWSNVNAANIMYAEPTT